MNSRTTSTPIGQRTRWWGKTALLSAAFALAGAQVNAQVGTNYQFTQTTGTYTPITGGTLLVQQTTTTSNAGSLDDGTVYTVPIPFTFTFDGVPYTSCTVTNNGSVSFGGTGILNNNYTPLSNTTAGTYSGAVAPYGRDLQGGFIFSANRTSGSPTLTLGTGGSTSGVTVGSVISGTGIPVGATVVAFDAVSVTLSANATSTGTNAAAWVWNGAIRYETIGTSPNRVHVIQWSNMKPFGTTLTTVNGFRMNMQVRLNETTNTVEVQYGDCTPGASTSTVTAQVGLRGPNATFPANVNNRTNTKGVNDNWLNSAAGTLNTSAMLFNNVAPANVIASGLTYRWGLPTPNITYTALANTCVTGARNLSANITDPDGVPTAGIGLPVLYWRINAGAYTPATGTFISGSQYDFSFGAGAVAGDVVSYYIVAQDNLGNVNGFPGGGSGYTANPPAAGTPTSTPSSYSLGFTLSGNYNVGAGEPAPFNTITGAVGRYNTGCLSGAVTFTLVDATYPSETFPITINNNAEASATNTLTIKASTTTTITGSNATAIFLFNGADFVTIDGSTSATANTVCPASAASRNLTISNTNTGTTSSVIWISTPTALNSATNNTVKNCIITGQGIATTNVAVGVGGVAVGSIPLVAPDNNSVVNNQISSAVFGVFVGGVSAAAKTQNTIVNQNTIATVGIGGIATPFQNNLTISGNSVTGISNAASSDVCAINAGFGVTGGFASATTGLADGVSNATITNNTIGTVSQTGTFSAVGIGLGNSITGTNLIANNMLSGVIANGTPGDFGGGIVIGGGTGSTCNVYYNTVNMQGTVTGATMPGYALCFVAAPTTANVFNNILLNTQTTGANLNRAFGLGVALPAAWLNMNNNDLFVSGTGSAVAQTTLLTNAGGVNHVSLANWQTNSSKDGASKNFAPTFISGTNLHIDNTVGANISNLFNQAAVVSVTNDIDCDSRASDPCIGADQFGVPACSGLPSAGTSSTTTPTLCAGLPASLSNNAVNLNSGIVYQWQVGPVGGPYADVVGGTGATTQNYTTAATTAGTYGFVLRVRCTNEIIPAGDSFSNEVVVTVNPSPIATITPSGPTTLCSPNTVDLQSSVGDSYLWSPGGATTQTITVSASGSYTVQVTTAGCSTTSAATVVTVNTPPVITSVTAVPPTVCQGFTSQLQVNLPTPSPYCNTIAFTNVESISNVTFSDINNSSTCGIGGAGYQDFTAVVGNVVAGNVYPITVSGTTDGNFVNYFTAFFDWNQDGVFEASQQIGFISNTACVATATNNVTVPPGALNGATRMRIVKDWVTGAAQAPPSVNYPSNPCGTYDFGQAEDYTLSVTGGVAPYSYSWNNAGTLNNAAIANPVATPTGTVYYVATVTAPNSCTDVDSVQVTVNPLPTITCPSDITGICSNDAAFALTGGSPAGGTYSGPGVSGGNFDPSVAGAGTHTISYSYTDGNGCTNTPCTFDITVADPTLWYADADNDLLGDPNVDSLACAQPVGYVADNTDLCPSTSGTVGSACNDGNPFTGGDVLQNDCSCAGTPVPCDNWTLAFTFAPNGSETTWQIVDATSPFVLASGGPYGGSSASQVVCVPQGACFRLTVNDSNNDGMGAGSGWTITDNNGRRIVDNTNNGTCFTSSATTGDPWCNQPASAQSVIAAHCGKLNWILSDVIIANNEPTVAAQWGIGDQTDDGYQFWFENPCGGYTRRILRNHATSGGNGPANALRATKLALSAMVTNPLPVGALLNVRVRPLVNGVYGNWGPACQFKLDPTACTLTKLNDTPSDPKFSCGATGKVVGASGNTGKIFAKIVTSGGSPATHYRFEISQPGEGYTRNAVSTSGVLPLAAWQTLPLLCGTYIYDVRVQASFNGGVSYCPYGDVCTVEITNNLASPTYCTTPGPIAGGGHRVDELPEVDFAMYPNPNRGEEMTLQLSGFSTEVAIVTMDVYDSYGKRVATRTFAVQDGFLNQRFDLGVDMAAGMYLVNLTAGALVKTERLVIQY